MAVPMIANFGRKLERVEDKVLDVPAIFCNGQFCE